MLDERLDVLQTDRHEFGRHAAVDQEGGPL
jgi:hypothetical protein